MENEELKLYKIPSTDTSLPDTVDNPATVSAKEASPVNLSGLSEQQVRDIVGQNISTGLKEDQVREIAMSILKSYDPMTEAKVRVIVNGMQKFLTGENIMMTGIQKSQNFVAGEAGWQIDAEGNSEFGNGIFRGSITATEGTIIGSLVIGSDGHIRSGQTDYDTGTGWWIGNDGGTPKFSIGDSVGNKLTWDGESLNFLGKTQSLVNLIISSSPVGENWASVFTDRTDLWFSIKGGGIIKIFNEVSGDIEEYDSINDWADMDNARIGVLLNGFLYLLLIDTGTTPDEYRVFRYDITNLSAGGTQMSFSGTAPDLTTDLTLSMTSDGTNFYISFDGGNSADAFDIAKYTLSGTTFTYDSTITCGSANAGFNASGGGYMVLSNGKIYSYDSTNRKLHTYDTDGTQLSVEEDNTYPDWANKMLNIKDSIYILSLGSETRGYMFRRLI